MFRCALKEKTATEDSTRWPVRKGPRNSVGPHGRLNFRLVDVEIGVNVLHVVVFFQGFYQAQHLLGLLPRQFNVVLRHHAHFGGLRLDASFVEGFLDGFERFRRSHNVPRRAIVLHIFGARLQH